MEAFERTTPQQGQLYMIERRLLYQTIVDRKPHVLLEVGTWKGGGSTLAIACALARNGRGHLYTCEPNLELYRAANNLYRNNKLNKFITLHNTISTDLISKLLGRNLVPDFMFFDGPEDPKVAIQDMLKLEPRLPDGAVFMMHDWIQEGSHKCDLIKPYIENSPRWRIDALLKPPESVGLVVATKIS